MPSRTGFKNTARKPSKMREHALGAIVMPGTKVRKNDDISTLESRPRLSQRQEDCLRGVLELKSAKQIARDLGITPGGVEKHLRTCRDKFGVDTTAAAARIFFLDQNGVESPQYRFSHLADSRPSEQQGLVPEQPFETAPEDGTGAQSLDRKISARQTLLAIAAVSFFSIVGLLLLVACADGIRSLVSR